MEKSRYELHTNHTFELADWSSVCPLSAADWMLQEPSIAKWMSELYRTRDAKICHLKMIVDHINNAAYYLKQAEKEAALIRAGLDEPRVHGHGCVSRFNRVKEAAIYAYKQIPEPFKLPQFDSDPRFSLEKRTQTVSQDSWLAVPLGDGWVGIISCYDGLVMVDRMASKEELRRCITSAEQKFMLKEWDRRLSGGHYYESLPELV